MGGRDVAKAAGIRTKAVMECNAIIAGVLAGFAETSGTAAHILCSAVNPDGQVERVHVATTSTTAVKRVKRQLWPHRGKNQPPADRAPRPCTIQRKGPEGPEELEAWVDILRINPYLSSFLR